MSQRSGLSLRPFTPNDLPHVMRLFRETVHTVNAPDYTPKQLEAWAPEHPDEAEWLERMSGSTSFVVEHHKEIVGFGSLARDGKIDTLYVGATAQKKGVGAAILVRLLAEARTREHKTVYTEASITARPFFEKHGFSTAKEQMRVRNGESLINYVMTKAIEDSSLPEEDGEEGE